MKGCKTSATSVNGQITKKKTVRQKVKAKTIRDNGTIEEQDIRRSID